ncbi:hypothetical protein [Streptomyces prasinus]|uniref:hypothetical protein n=1 Tax=Streptomyces prasinus TaxID=67345 RepID=UPI000AA8D316|nr:hypothetical protein [Streptomyces prasinus]
MPEQSSEEPTEPDSSSLPDDVWAKFVEDSERNIRASAPEEPSARARMVTERLRAMDEAQARAGGGGKRRWGRNASAAPPARPEGWRTGPAPQDVNSRASGRRGRGRWSVVGVLVAAAVAVVAVDPSGALSWLPSGLGEGSGASDGANPVSGDSAVPPAPETARPSGAPSAAPAGMPTRERPFAGSPAARWGSGADAIRLPEVEAKGEGNAVNGVPVADVEAALKGAKEFLIASNLDRAVLMGAAPKKALALIDPLAVDHLAEVRAGLRRPTEKNDPTWTFSRFDPDEVELMDDVRVRGRLTFEPVRGTAGKVVVRADYTFVYAVAPAGGGDEVTRSIVRRTLELDAADPARFRVTDGRVRLLVVKSEIFNDDCRNGDGVIRPRFFTDRSDGPTPTGEARDPYDRSQGVREADRGCGTASRT